MVTDERTDEVTSALLELLSQLKTKELRINTDRDMKENRCQILFDTPLPSTIYILPSTVYDLPGTIQSDKWFRSKSSNNLQLIDNSHQIKTSLQR